MKTTLPTLLLLAVQAYGQNGNTDTPEHDSLAVALADVELRKALVEVARTSFLNRAIPKISIGATLGTRDLIFSETGAFVLPTDSYRLTVSMSISDLLDNSAHERALLGAEEARLKEQDALERMRVNGEERSRKREDLESTLRLQLLEERRLLRIVQYHELLYSQGKTDMLPLERSRIEYARARSARQRTARLLAKGAAGD
jgi:outer membrane protein TolC